MGGIIISPTSYGVSSPLSTLEGETHFTDGLQPTPLQFDNATIHIFAGDELIATVEEDGSDTSIRYIHTDHLGGTQATTDEDGELVEIVDYYPYGEQRINEVSGVSSERRKFTGHEYDTQTDLTYAENRYYNQNNGRWLSQDLASRTSPEQFLTDPQQLNTYAYARNNPLIFVDRDGKKVELVGRYLQKTDLGVHTFLKFTPDASNGYSLSHLGLGDTSKITIGAYNKGGFIGNLVTGINGSSDFNIGSENVAGSILINTPSQYENQIEFEKALFAGHYSTHSDLGAYSWSFLTGDPGLYGQVISNNYPSHLLLQTGVPQEEILSLKDSYQNQKFGPLTPGLGIGLPVQRTSSLIDGLNSLKTSLAKFSASIKKTFLKNNL